MAMDQGNPRGIPSLQPQLSASHFQISIDQEDQRPASVEYGDPEMDLVIKQAPVLAQVLGKGKHRNPVDPPPVVQLIGRRATGSNYVYHSPFLFMTCTLVPEDYDPQTRTPQLQGNYLAGTVVSSMHQLKDATNTLGGFFVFGDLSVRHEGKFRLRFVLYDRDQHDTSPSVYYVKETLSAPITVYSAKSFPGTSGSTILTRAFGQQGVKLRVRQGSQAVSRKKRSQRASTAVDTLRQQSERKQHPTDDLSASPSEESKSLNHIFSEDTSLDNASGMAALSTTKPLRSEGPLLAMDTDPALFTSPRSADILSTPSSLYSNYSIHTYPRAIIYAKPTTEVSFPATAAYGNQYSGGFGISSGSMAQQMGIMESRPTGMSSSQGFSGIPARTTTAPYTMASNSIGQLSSYSMGSSMGQTYTEPSSRTSEGLGFQATGNPFRPLSDGDEPMSGHSSQYESSQ
ncbi:hypothetical protein G7046_g3844 [Stylonectria norvegica]|nr:hypothetical protein G7046_g3844 [Stylonectria norvegica]